jgi:hypothetical protein
MNRLLIIGACSLLLAGCTIPLSKFISPKKTEYWVHYAVGDRYKTLKPMFLVVSTDDVLWITPPGNMSPTLEKYQANEGKSQFDVKRLLPAGTRIEVVSIKETDAEGPTPYFKIDGDSTLVRGYFYNDKYEKSGKNSILIDVLPDSNFYQKIN